MIRPVLGVRLASPYHQIKEAVKQLVIDQPLGIAPAEEVKLPLSELRLLSGTRMRNCMQPIKIAISVDETAIVPEPRWWDEEIRQ